MVWCHNYVFRWKISLFVCFFLFPFFLDLSHICEMAASSFGTYTCKLAPAEYVVQISTIISTIEYWIYIISTYLLESIYSWFWSWKAAIRCPSSTPIWYREWNSSDRKHTSKNKARHLFWNRCHSTHDGFLSWNGSIPVMTFLQNNFSTGFMVKGERVKKTEDNFIVVCSIDGVGNEGEIIS